MNKILLILVIASPLMLSQSAGNSGLSFLKFGFGARNVAMGDAGNAVSNDVTSLFYNPAKLASGTGSEIMLMHNEWIQDVRSEILGVRSALFGIPFALGFNVTSVSDIEVRTRPGEPDTKINANYFFGSLSSGYNINESFATGFSIKYLYEGLLSDEATGWAVDLGINYFAAVKGLTASAVIKNLGSMNALRDEKTKLPAEARLGAAYMFRPWSDFDFVIGLEGLRYLSADDMHLNTGLEIIYYDVIALRGGYQSGHESKSFSGGLGIMWGNLKFDYAFQPFTYGLGSANLFSVQFRF